VQEFFYGSDSFYLQRFVLCDPAPHAVIVFSIDLKMPFRTVAFDYAFHYSGGIQTKWANRCSSLVYRVTGGLGARPMA